MIKHFYLLPDLVAYKTKWPLHPLGSSLISQSSFETFFRKIICLAIQTYFVVYFNRTNWVQCCHILFRTQILEKNIGLANSYLCLLLVHFLSHPEVCGFNPCLPEPWNFLEKIIISKMWQLEYLFPPVLHFTLKLRGWNKNFFLEEVFFFNLVMYIFGHFANQIYSKKCCLCLGLNRWPLQPTGLCSELIGQRYGVFGKSFSSLSSFLSYFYP